MQGKPTEVAVRDCAPILCNIYKRLDGTTHKVWKVPESWKNHHVIFGSINCNIFVIFGHHNAMVADPTEESSDGGSNTLVRTPDTCDRIAQDTVARIWVPRYYLTTDATPVQRSVDYFAVVGDVNDETAGWFAYVLTEGHHEGCPA